MNILIASNCATPILHEICTAAFPSDDVRAVVLPQARVWVTQGHAPFLAFLGKIDLLICLPRARPLLEPHLPATAQLVEIERFHYTGGRPDCIQIKGHPSPTTGGDRHSRIAASAFACGLSEADALTRFTPAHFEALGYCAASTRDAAVAETCEAHAATGLDLRDAFPRWQANGDFLYQPNHPESHVFLDLTRRALDRAGVLDASAQTRLDRLGPQLSDPLADGVIWPVYPEIAEALRLHAPRRTWRTPQHKGGQHFGTAEMIARSYASFRASPTARDDILAAMGGTAAIRASADA